jgi:GntR family transcriptional regulator/MocR family aminotransferase
MRSNPVREFQTNLPWDAVLQLDDSGGGPLNERLRQALLSAIRAGRLPTGSTLPPSRALAADLGCSRWVVTEAYGQLIAQGYLEGTTGSATRVSWSASPRKHSAPAPVRQELRFNLAVGIPDLRMFPRRTWAASIRAEVAQASYRDLAYPPHGGHPRLRWVLADYLTRLRGAAVEPDDITVSTSIIDGITRMCQALCRAGVSTVGVEEPGWPRLVAAARVAGLTPVPVAVDDSGMCVDELAAQPAIKAVIIAPAHQFPTGTVLAPSRRAAILEWARRVDGVILEDDYDAEFRYDRRPIGVMQSMDPSHVVLLGSVSKTLSPALRIGWIAAPPRWTQDLRAATVPSPEPPTLDQLAFARFIETGSFDRHLRAARKRYRARRDSFVRALKEELPQCRVSGAAAGLHLLLHLPDDVNPEAVVHEAALLGVRALSLGQFRVRDGEWGNGLVIGYGSLADELVPEAVHQLALAINAA